MAPISTDSLQDIWGLKMLPNQDVACGAPAREQGLMIRDWETRVYSRCAQRGRHCSQALIPTQPNAPRLKAAQTFTVLTLSAGLWGGPAWLPLGTAAGRVFALASPEAVLVRFSVCLPGPLPSLASLLLETT